MKIIVLSILFIVSFFNKVSANIPFGADCLRGKYQCIYNQSFESRFVNGELLPPQMIMQFLPEQNIEIIGRYKINPDNGHYIHILQAGNYYSYDKPFQFNIHGQSYNLLHPTSSPTENTIYFEDQGYFSSPDLHHLFIITGTLIRHKTATYTPHYISVESTYIGPSCRTCSILPDESLYYLNIQMRPYQPAKIISTQWKPHVVNISFSMNSKYLALIALGIALLLVWSCACMRREYVRSLAVVKEFESRVGADNAEVVNSLPPHMVFATLLTLRPPPPLIPRKPSQAPSDSESLIMALAESYS